MSFSLPKKRKRRILFTYILLTILFWFPYTYFSHVALEHAVKLESFTLTEVRSSIRDYLEENHFDPKSLIVDAMREDFSRPDDIIIDYKGRGAKNTEHLLAIHMSLDASETDSFMETFIQRAVYLLLPTGDSYTFFNNTSTAEAIQINVVRRYHEIYASTTIESNSSHYDGQFIIHEKLSYRLLPYAKKLLVLGFVLYFLLSLGLTYIHCKVHKIYIRPLKEANRSLDSLINNWDVKPIMELGKQNKELDTFVQKINKIIVGSAKNYHFTTEFIDEATHETKNHINNIVNIAELLTDKNEAYHKELNMIVNEAYTLNSLLDGLKNSPNILTRKKDYQKEVVVVDQVVDDLVQMKKSFNQDRVFNTKFDNASITIMSKKKLYVVVRNLLDNAIKYSNKETPIDVSVANNENGEIKLKVTNEGPTIPSDIYDKIFEKHYRGRETELTVPGSGYGLWIVREILHENNGKVEVESKDGKTTFTVTLKTYTLKEEEAMKRVYTTKEILQLLDDSV